MKKKLIHILIYSVCTVAVAIAQTLPKTDVISVNTALNHLTVLEFGEPVTTVAAGSSAFHIERQGDKVLIEPKSAGTATDLLVWTASRRFNFELQPAGEVSKMAVAIDLTIPKPRPVVTPDDQMQQIVDSVMKRALLGAERIDSSALRPRSEVLVRIQQVFRTDTTVYIHYKIENHSTRPFRIATPSVHLVEVGRTPVSLLGLAHSQLDRKTSDKLKRTKDVSLSVALAEIDGEDVSSHQERQGVIAIRQNMQTPQLVELQFSASVRAMFVL